MSTGRVLQLKESIADCHQSIQGVGLQTCFELYRNGAHVLMGCRSQAKYEIAKEAIRSRLTPEQQRGKLNFVQVDTSTIKKAQSAAYDVLARADITRLDIFIANAGKGSTLGPLNEDGVEPFMATNCLGHSALLQLLLPLIIETSKTAQTSCRIVFVSSIAHLWSSLIWPFSITPTFASWDDVNDKRIGVRGLYSRSKVRFAAFSLK